MRLEIKNITKEYDKLVLDDISIKLNDYKSIAIIGKSGCGKSTLLRLIAGIEFPQNGSITVGEHEIKEDDIIKYQKTIGFVFQKHNLFPHLTLKENITLILEKTRGFTTEDANKKAEDLLMKLHLKDEMNKEPSKVSGGQAQRASIARALSTDPELLLLDEPTASLDPILTNEVLMAIKELKGLGKDFIFVTHELTFVKSFAEYIIFIDEGKIVEHGKVSILDAPKTDELKLFMKNVIFD